MKDRGDTPPDGGHNPLDGYERFLKSRKARFQRHDAETLAVDVEGQLLELYWNSEDEALHCSCALDMQLTDDVRDLAAPVVMHINRRQWLGHFEVTEDGFPCFRYTMLFHGSGAVADTEMIEELTDIVIRSCEQYTPAFALMAEASGAADFPRVMNADGSCAPLGLALLETGGRG